MNSCEKSTLKVTERSGGAYYYKPWSPKSEDIPKRRVQYEVGDEIGFDDWRHFMKEYLKEKDDNEKPVSSPTPNKTEDVAWDTHVEHARQIHMKKARQLARAVTGSKEMKTAKMFQERFERSEKYALVRDPVPPPPEGKVEEREQPTHATGEDVVDSTREEDITKFEIPTEVANSLQAVQCADKLQDELAFYSAPEPWRNKPDQHISIPTYKNFNRSPRGFVGSYLTSYC